MPDPISSQVGHGRLGIRNGERDALQLFGEPGGTPQVFAELRLGVPITTGWEDLGGGLYRVPFVEVVDGVPRDVVAVQTTERALSRAHSLAYLATTDGTFFYMPTSLEADTWDEVGATWDSGGFFDSPGVAAGFLYVHVDAAEVAETVVARILFMLGSDAVTQPVLGRDLLEGQGLFEDWATNPPGDWQFYDGGGGSLDESTQFRYEGASSAEIDGVIGFAQALYFDGLPVLTGQLYCVSGRYLVQRGTLSVQVSDSGANTNVIQSDGRSVGSAPITLRCDQAADVLDTTAYPWRRFSFYFRAHADGCRLAFVTSGVTDSVMFVDQVTLRPVHSWARAEPRISGAPTVKEGRSDSYFGAWHVGAGTLTLANGGAYWDSIVGRYDAINAEVVIYRGGRYPGQEDVTLDAARVGFVGRVTDVDLDERELRLELEDTHGQALAQVPPRTYEQESFPGADPRAFGRARAHLFGYPASAVSATYQASVVPVRIERTDADLGRYEVADCEGWEPGLVGSDLVSGRPAKFRLFSYEDTAARGDLSMSVELDDYHILTDWPTGRFDAISCLKAIPIDEEHQFFSFTVNGGVQLDARVLAGGQELVHLTVNANGAGATNVSAVGAATQWECVQYDDGAWAMTASSSAVSRTEVTCSALSGSASVDWVEVRVIVRAVAGVYGDADRFRIYVDRGGTKYYSAYYDDPGAAFVDITKRFLPADVGLSQWSESDVNGLKWGIEYDPNGVDYLQVNLIDPRAYRFKATPPSASVPGILTPRLHAAALQAAMLQAASATSGITVTWSDVDFKFTVVFSGAFTSGTLLTKTGRQKSGWAFLGWGAESDKTGATTYTSDQAFYVADSDIDGPVLRVQAVGYADDALGTYTGQAGAAIEKGPDILRWLLRRLMAVPADRIDSASFEASRASASALCVYVGQQEAVGEIIERIETGDLADLVVDGDRYYYSARASAWATGDVELFDRDYIDGVRSSQKQDELYGTLRVAWGQDPARGTQQTQESATDSPVRFGRRDTRVFETYHVTAEAAQVPLAWIAAQAAEPKRRYQVRVRGQMLGMRIGQIARLNIVGGGMANAAGEITPVDARLIDRDTDDLAQECTVVLVEV